MAAYTCNNCTAPLSQDRFKCIACHDFDLCSKCCMEEDLPEMYAVGHDHKNHILIHLHDETNCELEPGSADSQESCSSNLSKESDENRHLALKVKLIDALELFQFDITSVSKHVGIPFSKATELVCEIFDEFYQNDNTSNDDQTPFVVKQLNRPIGQSAFARMDFLGNIQSWSEQDPPSVDVCWDMIHDLSTCCAPDDEEDEGDDEMDPAISINAASNHSKVVEYRLVEDMFAFSTHDSRHAYKASALNQCCQLAGILQDSYPEMRARLQRFPLVGMGGTKRTHLVLRNTLKQAIKEQDFVKYSSVLAQGAIMYPHLQALLQLDSESFESPEEEDAGSLGSQHGHSDWSDVQTKLASTPVHPFMDTDEGEPATTDSSEMDISAINTTPVVPCCPDGDTSEGAEGGERLAHSAVVTPTSQLTPSTAVAVPGTADNEKDELWPFNETEVEQHSASADGSQPSYSASVDGSQPSYSAASGNGTDQYSPPEKAATPTSANSEFHCKACNYTAHETTNWKRHLKSRSHLDRRTSSSSNPGSSILSYFKKVTKVKTDHTDTDTDTDKDTGAAVDLPVSKRSKLLDDRKEGDTHSSKGTPNSSEPSGQTPSPLQASSPPDGVYTGTSTSSEASSESAKHQHFSSKQFLY